MIYAAQPAVTTNRMIDAVQPAAVTDPMIDAVQPAAVTDPMIDAVQPAAVTDPMIDAVQPAAVTNSMCMADAMQQHSPPFAPRTIPCINSRYSKMNSEEIPRSGLKSIPEVCLKYPDCTVNARLVSLQLN